MVKNNRLPLSSDGENLKKLRKDGAVTRVGRTVWDCKATVKTQNIFANSKSSFASGLEACSKEEDARISDSSLTLSISLSSCSSMMMRNEFPSVVLSPSKPKPCSFRYHHFLWNFNYLGLP